jgi:hypothetical protein
MDFSRFKKEIVKNINPLIEYKINTVKGELPGMPYPT